MGQFVEYHIEGINEVKKMLAVLGEEAKQALKKTINQTVQGVRQRETQEVLTVFDRPNPRTQQSIRTIPIKGEGTYEGVVYINYDGSGGTAPSKYLQPQIFGGKRALKRFEVLLQRKGYLPPGKIAVPGKDADIDQYGNQRPSQIVQILSQLNAFPNVGYSANAQDRKNKKKYAYKGFYIIPGAGIFQTGFGGVKTLMRFVNSTPYRKRFDFYGVGQAEADRIMIKNANEALAYALNKSK